MKEKFIRAVKNIPVEASSVSALMKMLPNCYAKGYLQSRIDTTILSPHDFKGYFLEWANENIWGDCPENSIKVNLKIDIKTLRKTVTLITGESETDESLQKEFFESEPIEIDLIGQEEKDVMQTILPFVGIVLEKRKAK